MVTGILCWRGSSLHMIFLGFGQEDLNPPRNNQFFYLIFEYGQHEGQWSQKPHQLWSLAMHILIVEMISNQWSFEPTKWRQHDTNRLLKHKSAHPAGFTNSYREKPCTPLNIDILTQQMKLGFRWFPFQNRWSSAVKFPGCKSIGIKTWLSTPRTSTRSLVLRPLPRLWNCEASLGSTSTVERVVMDFFESSHRILGVYLPIHKWLMFMVNVGKYTGHSDGVWWGIIDCTIWDLSKPCAH